MPLREKHTSYIFAAYKHFITKKGIGRLLLAIFFLFIFSSGFASEQVVEAIHSDKTSNIVFSASDNNKVIISQGKITATEGNSIHLLPGTHIKSGEQLIVDITNKSQQEALAEKIAKENEKEMLASIAKQREFLLLPDEKEALPAILYQENIPLENSELGQQHLPLIAPLVNNTYSFNAAITLLHNKQIHFNNLMVLAKQSPFTPLSSWGDCAKTIKVMRC